MTHIKNQNPGRAAHRLKENAKSAAADVPSKALHAKRRQGEYAKAETEGANMLIKLIEDKYPQMSPSYQKIARYIKDNYSDVLFCSLAELSERIGTSTATIVRFSYFIGYSGFSEMQRHVQSTVRTPEDELPPLQPTSKDALERCVEGVSAMYHNLDTEQLSRICRQIMEAKNVLLIGYMGAFGTAAELLHRLSQIRENVYFTRLINDWNDILRMMAPGTLVIVVSFRPHYAYTLDCAKVAARNGCYVVTLSDDKLNPFATLSNDFVSFNLSYHSGAGMPNLAPVEAYINELFVYLDEHYRDSFRLPEADPSVYLNL